MHIRWLCSVAGVSRGGYYKWLAEKEAREQREAKDRADFNIVLEAYKYRGIDKGVQGIHMRLLHQDPPIRMNHKKIRRLMRKYGLQCPIRKPSPYRQAIKEYESEAVADNLLNRQFEEFNPREAFTTDITYLFYDGGKKRSYLSVLRDTCTHEVMSHVLSWSMVEDFVLETINHFIANHKSEILPDALVHSDQGIHYKCTLFRQLLKDRKLRQSMSRKANCWDNAPQESFFGHMKDEIGDKILECKTYDEVKMIIDDYMNYYNNERGQWKLAKLTPVEYYRYMLLELHGWMDELECI